jgi:putative oxidoreductase
MKGFPTASSAGALKAADMLLALGLGGVFLAAAAGKVLDPVKFLGGVSQYALLKGWSLPIMAAAMPGVEIMAGLGLVIGWRRRCNALLLSLLLLMFMAAMASAMARGLELDCSCFDLLGAGPSTVGWGTLGRDFILLLPALWLALRSEASQAADAPRAGEAV